MVLGELGESISAALRKVTASRDVDQALLSEMLGEIYDALVANDVEVALADQFRAAVAKEIDLKHLPPGMNRRKVIQKAVFQQLTKLVDPGKTAFKPTKGATNVIMFVGLQGAGKTTTISKVGYHYRRKGFKVGLVCADTFRAGAFAQLKQNAIKAKLPFYGSHDETDPVRAARDGVAKFKEEAFDVILVDTSGRHKQEESLFEEMRQIADSVQPDDVVFVLDASIGQAARAQADAFKSAVEVGSVIITKMDGHAKGGGALSAVAATGSPIVFLGSGEHIADLDAFNAESYVKRLLGLGDIQGLMEQLQDAGLDQNNEALQNMEKGQFSLRDMRSQFESVMNMGPLSKMMQMMPGMAANLMPKGQEAEATKRLRGFLCIMDSMTAAELDDASLFEKQPNRILRVARGSGNYPHIVTALLTEHKRFEMMVSKMADMQKKMTKAHGRVPQNQAGMVNSMAQMINPEVLSQLGGASGLQEMISQLGGVEGLMGGGGLGGMFGGMGGGGGGAARGGAGGGRGGRGRGRGGPRRRK